MLGLFRKFPFAAACVKSPKAMRMFGCEILPNEKGELICKTEQSAFVISDDVYAYYADNTAVWYSKGGDLARGADIVYRVNVNDLSDQKRGVIDQEGSFLYEEDGYLFCAPSEGEVQRLCSVKALDPLSCLLNPNSEPGIRHMENLFSAESRGVPYSDGAFYKDLNELHALVSSLDEERSKELLTSSVSARLIIKVIETCCKMNKNVSEPLKKIFERGLS